MKVFRGGIMGKGEQASWNQGGWPAVSSWWRKWMFSKVSRLILLEEEPQAEE